MQIHEFAVAVAEASVDATLPNRMTGIIRIGHGKAFQDAELSRNGDDRGRYADCPKSQTAAFAGSNGALWRYGGGSVEPWLFTAKKWLSLRAISLEGKPACRIKYTQLGGGYRSPEDKWPGFRKGLLER